jgi:succinate dehydrogenase flavin-adding protein (antitoxin of CptAB toxin-antitoxin module)
LKDIDLNLDNMNSLEKRDYQDVLNQSDSQVADIITKKI